MKLILRMKDRNIMKKMFISFITLFMLFIFLFSFKVFAYNGNASYGTVPKTYEKIEIDGLKDDIYDDGLQIDITRDSNFHELHVFAKTYLLWNEGRLYVYAEVMDSDIAYIGEEEQKINPWNCDNIEVYVDEKNNSEKVALYRVNVKGYPSMVTEEGISLNTPEEIGDKFKYACTKKFLNYTAEFMIPLTCGAGDKIGLNIQVTDKYSDVFYFNYIQPENSLGKGDASDAETYDYIVLSNNPATDDSPFIFIITSILSLSIIIVLFYKKFLFR